MHDDQLRDATTAPRATSAADIDLILGVSEALHPPIRDRRTAAKSLAELGVLDGPDAIWRGDLFDPQTVGLKKWPTIEECADLLCIPGSRLKARQRARLRRFAVVSVMVDDTPRETLRAATRWWQHIRELAEATEHGSPRASMVRRELDIAAHAMFDVGAAALANAEARKWARPGTKSETNDLVQSAYVGMMGALDRYDPDRGAVSSFAFYAIQDQVAGHVHDVEHPQLPRSAFKKRGRILRTANRLLAANPDWQMHSDALVDGILADVDGVTRVGVTAVLAGTAQVPLASDIDDDSAHRPELADPAADTESHFIDASLRDIVSSAMNSCLDDDEIDIIVRSEGLGGEDAQPMRDIGATYGRSRTWAGGKRTRALAKVADQVAREDDATPVDPSTLRDRIPSNPPADPLFVQLTEREAFVARCLLGFGQTPLPGSATERAMACADLLGTTTDEVRVLASRVVRLHAALAGWREDAATLTTADVAAQFGGAEFVPTEAAPTLDDGACDTTKANGEPLTLEARAAAHLRTQPFGRVA